MESVRIDKYLWAIRLFKTRTIATEACKTGHVKLNGVTVKPSHEVKLGESFTLQKGADRKIIRVKEIINNRVDSKKAILCYDDLSPVVAKDGIHTIFNIPVLSRERGSGRPTKKERRDIDDLRES